MNSFLSILSIIFIFINVAIAASIDCFDTKKNQIACIKDPKKMSNKIICSGRRTRKILYCGTSEHLRFTISQTVEQDTSFKINEEDCKQLVENKTLNYMGFNLKFDYNPYDNVMIKEFVVNGTIKNTGDCTEDSQDVMIDTIQIQLQREDTQQLSSAFTIIGLDSLEKKIMSSKHIEAAAFSLRILSYGVTLFYVVGATFALKKLYNWLVNRRQSVLISNI